jgi:uncharacterized protein (TIGR02147 family)
MDIYSYTDYKKYSIDRVKMMPKRGHGEFQRIATQLGMHSTSVSHVFKGSKDLSLEQASKLCLHWGLSELESDYLISLVELARAGTLDLRKIIELRLKKIRISATNLVHRVPKSQPLSESEKSKFYSNWYYSAIRLLCDIKDYQTVDTIAQRLNLPLGVVNESLKFLLSTGLCIEEKGHYKMAFKRTFLESTSPLMARHHTNWRLKAIDHYDKWDYDTDLAFTSPMTLSINDKARVRKILHAAIEEILKFHLESPSEELQVLNIDWFKLRP